MRHTRSMNNEEQTPTNTPRRSPRFLHQNQTDAQNRVTPNPTTAKTQKRVEKDTNSKSSSKSRLANLSNLDSPKTAEKRVTRSSTRRSRFADSLEYECGEISKNRDKNSIELKDLEKSGNRCRRSARLEGRANVSKNVQVFLDCGNQNFVEKRVTRSCVRGNRLVYNQLSESNSDKDSLRRKGKPKVGADRCAENIEKRVTRSSSNRTNTSTLVDKSTNLSADNSRKIVVSDEKRPKENDGLLKICNSKREDVKDCGDEDKHCKGKKNVGEKRKRCEVEGWSEEQELALRKAYFTVKPTPRFWNEVARMVPGKSANECFDRIHLDQLTPSEPKKRSRANKKEPSPLAFSASKLLSPAQLKNKKLPSRNRRTFLAQKTVRQLLQKQQNEDQNYEADLFDILESTIEPSLDFIQAGTSSFASPTPNKGSKHHSRLNSSKKAAFVSPPVLKQIKNKALHEKYIDQLHCRDAKRKAESLRNAKRVEGKNVKSKSRLEMNSVKAAKDALVLDAQDAVSQLRRLQSSTNYDTDDDDNTSYNDEDEDEDC